MNLVDWDWRHGSAVFSPHPCNLNSKLRISIHFLIATYDLWLLTSTGCQMQWAPLMFVWCVWVDTSIEQSHQLFNIRNGCGHTQFSFVGHRAYIRNQCVPCGGMVLIATRFCGRRNSWHFIDVNVCDGYFVRGLALGQRRLQHGQFLGNLAQPIEHFRIGGIVGRGHQHVVYWCVIAVAVAGVVGAAAIVACVDTRIIGCHFSLTFLFRSPMNICLNGFPTYLCKWMPFQLVNIIRMINEVRKKLNRIEFTLFDYKHCHLTFRTRNNNEEGVVFVSRLDFVLSKKRKISFTCVVSLMRSSFQKVVVDSAPVFSKRIISLF